MPFWVPETTGVIRKPLSALIVIFSGMNRVLGAVPESWSVPEFMRVSVPVPETVLLIVRRLPAD